MIHHWKYFIESDIKVIVSFSSASNRIIAAKDYAAVQLNIAEVDESTGRMTGQYKTYALCGELRNMVSAHGHLLESLSP